MSSLIGHFPCLTSLGAPLGLFCLKFAFSCDAWQRHQKGLWAKRFWARAAGSFVRSVDRQCKYWSKTATPFYFVRTLQCPHFPSENTGAKFRWSLYHSSVLSSHCCILHFLLPAYTVNINYASCGLVFRHYWFSLFNISPDFAQRQELCKSARWL